MYTEFIPAAISIMGVEVTPFQSYSDATKCAANLIAAGTKASCVAINPEKVFRASKDPRLFASLRNADMRVCDGIGIVIGARILYHRKIKRCTGCDLFLRLIAAAAANGWRVFLLGASADSNAGACLKLQSLFPRLRVAGRCDGYFENSDEIVRQINESGAQLLFVGMGSPRQELWIDRYRRSINASFCMGVGGTFDVISGKVPRAPRIFRKTGTEFLFRLATNPRRLRRQLALPLFMLQLLGERLSGSGV